MSARVTQFAVSSFDRAGGTFRFAARQPSWIARATLIAFLLVIGAPILLVLLLALLVGVVVFGVLAGVNRVVTGVRGVMPRDDGRENVRVIQRSNTP